MAVKRTHGIEIVIILLILTECGFRNSVNSTAHCLLYLLGHPDRLSDRINLTRLRAALFPFVRSDEEDKLLIIWIVCHHTEEIIQIVS